jgi:membrane protease subunit HflC
MSWQSLFIVQEGERAFRIRLGLLEMNSKTQQPIVYTPGIHYKWPILDKIYKIDPRDQLWIMDSDRVQTVEQLYLLVDFYFKWKVDDFPLFFKLHSAGGDRPWDEARRNVEVLLKQKVRNAVLEEFGRRPLSRLIAEDRKDIMNTFGPTIEESLRKLGVALVDFRLKKIERPEDVSEKLYNRMRTEREKSAAMHRAKGKEKAEKIRAQADYDVQVLLAQSQSSADILRGEADAKAAQYYADAFGQYKDFYSFTRSLQTYREIFQSKDDLIFLKTDNPLFDILQERSDS